MLDEILVPKSVQPLSRLETSLEAMPSSQFCLHSDSGMPSCIYTHEIVSLILAVAILIKAIRGSSGK